MTHDTRRPRTRGNGEGSVFRRSRDGRYVARYRPVGERGREWVRDTREAAELELTRYRAARERGAPAIDSRMTLGTWARRWHASLTGREGTLEQYGYNLERFLAADPIARLRLRDLRRIHVEEWLARVARTRKVRGAGVVGPSTVAGARRTLSVILAAAVENDLLAANVAAGRLRNAPRPVVEKVYPTPEEANAILEELRGEELYPLFLLARWSGARIGELRGLRPGDVSPRGTVTFAKQSGDTALKTDASRRPLPMPDHVLEALAHYPRRSMLSVFTTRTGAALDNRRLERVLAAACVRAGVRHYTPHAFRHAFAAELLGARLPDSYVSRLMGHASITTTVHEYGHLRPTRGATVTELSTWWSGGASLDTYDTYRDTYGARR